MGNKGHAAFAQRLMETKLAGRAKQTSVLPGGVFIKKSTTEEEHEKFSDDQLEIFILGRIEDLKEENSSLLAECKKLVEASELSEKVISELKHDNIGKQMEREILDKELKIRNEKLILLQNQVNKLLELNGDLRLETNALRSLALDMKKEIDEVSIIKKVREKENMGLRMKLKKVQEELALTTQLCENDMAKMFEELQFSTVFRGLLEDQLDEVRNGNISKDAEINFLERRIGTLECENGGLKTQLAPLIMSLKDSISSLETRTLHAKLQKNKEVVQVSSKTGNTDQELLDVFSMLKDLDNKVKAIDKSVARKEKLAALRSTETSKIRACENGKYSVPIYDDSEIENEHDIKDIMLDSESSSRELSRQLEKRSKRGQSWGSSDLDRSIDLIAERDEKVISNSYKNRSSGIMAVHKTNVTESLNSDAGKSSNLWVTVQDFMRNAKILGKGKKGKATYERDTPRNQQEEAEEDITRLLDHNKEIKRRVQLRDYFYGVKSPVYQLRRKKPAFCACVKPLSQGD